MDIDQSVATERPITEVENRIWDGLAKGRLNYDLGDYEEALLHLTDAYQTMKANGPIERWYEVRTVPYYLYASYVMAPPKVKARFQGQVHFLHLEGIVEKYHPRAVWLVSKLGRPGLRIHNALKRFDR